MKPVLLFLSHRIPYPPNKGDKIRSFHLLKYLSENFRIFLAAFIDDPADWQYCDRLSKWCDQSYFVGLKPRLGKLRSIQGLFKGQPLTLPYYYDVDMAAWISRVAIQERISNILIYSSAMAQYATSEAFATINKVIDFVDVDSDKWRQYASKKSWPMNWVYNREARLLLEYEREIASRFSASLFVSEIEADLFRKLAPESVAKISYYSNGVDTAEFDPAIAFADPYPDSVPVVVFTGAMDYWPNEDAVFWFANEVLPTARKEWPNLQFYIVGSKPSERVKALEKISGVKVTGRVPDIRPYIRYAAASVAPMRIARGIQNKVLEAMAMAKPVIVSPMGLEGIDAEHAREVLVAAAKDQYIESLSKILSGSTGDMGSIARAKVVKDYSWESSLPKIDQWLI